MKRIFYNPLYDPNADLGLFGCGHEKCAADFSDGPGVRKKYILHYIVSGAGWYEVKGNRYHLKKGDVFAIYPDDLVRYYADENDPWEFCWIVFGGNSAYKCYDSVGLSHERLVVNQVENGFLKCIISCLEYIEKSKGEISQIRLVSCIIACLSYLDKFNQSDISQSTKTLAGQEAY